MHLQFAGSGTMWTFQSVHPSCKPRSLSCTCKYLHDGEMLNSCSSSGWQVLNFLEEVETSGTFFDKKKTELTEFTSHPPFLVIRLLKVVQKSFVIFNHRILTYRSFNSLLFSKFPYDMRNCYSTILSIKYNVTKATLHPLKQSPFFHFIFL